MHKLNGVADIKANEPKSKTKEELIKMFSYIKPHRTNIVIVPKAVSQYHNGIQLGKDQINSMANQVVRDGALVLSVGAEVKDIKPGDVVILDARQGGTENISHMEKGKDGFHCIILDMFQLVATTKEWKSSIASYSDLIKK